MRGFKDFYLFKKEEHPKRSKRDASHLTHLLNNDLRVEWAEQQMARTRTKRDSINMNTIWMHYLRSIAEDPLERGKKYPFPHNDHTFNDELWSRQWYLHDTTNVPNLPKMDLGVKEVFNFQLISFIFQLLLKKWFFNLSKDFY